MTACKNAIRLTHSSWSGNPKAAISAKTKRASTCLEALVYNQGLEIVARPYDTRVPILQSKVLDIFKKSSIKWAAYVGAKLKVQGPYEDNGIAAERIAAGSTLAGDGQSVSRSLFISETAGLVLVLFLSHYAGSGGGGLRDGTSMANQWPMYIRIAMERLRIGASLHPSAVFV